MKATTRQGSLWAAIALAAVVLSACGGDAGEEGDELAEVEQTVEATRPAPACEPSGTEITLVAPPAETGVAPTFDQDCVAVPAGTAFTVELVNDDFLEHNFAIYPDQASYDFLFRGERFRGPDEQMTYEVDAIAEPGEYFFACDVHRTVMNGVLVVG